MTAEWFFGLRGGDLRAAIRLRDMRLVAGIARVREPWRESCSVGSQTMWTRWAAGAGSR